MCCKYAEICGIPLLGSRGEPLPINLAITLSLAHALKHCSGTAPAHAPPTCTCTAPAHTPAPENRSSFYNFYPVGESRLCWFIGVLLKVSVTNRRASSEMWLEQFWTFWRILSLKGYLEETIAEIRKTNYKFLLNITRAFQKYIYWWYLVKMEIVIIVELPARRFVTLIKSISCRYFFRRNPNL